MTLTLNQQRSVVRLLPASKRASLKKRCEVCEMRGEGLFDIIKSAGKFLVKELGPIAREVGPTVLKELVIPLLKQKIVGSGLKTAGGGLKLPGRGLRLAGQRGRSSKPCVVTKRGQKGKGLHPTGGRIAKEAKTKPNAWNVHVKRTMKANPQLQFKSALKLASKTFKKK